MSAEIETVAMAIYSTHWRAPSPTWDEASEEVRDWVRKQALSAMNALRAAGWSPGKRKISAPEPPVAAETEAVLATVSLGEETTNG